MPLGAPEGVSIRRAAGNFRLLRHRNRKESHVSVQRSGGNSTGIGLGGILVIVGIVVALIWSVWIGVIIALVGLIAFGGFARGKWY